MTWTPAGWWRPSTSSRSVWRAIPPCPSLLEMATAGGRYYPSLTRYRGACVPRMAWTVGVAMRSYFCTLALLWFFESSLIYSPGRGAL